MPADCVIIESSNLSVDESPDDEEIQLHYKSRRKDPFLKIDSLVISGNSKALVCCVGENSTRDKKAVNLSE